VLSQWAGGDICLRSNEFGSVEAIESGKWPNLEKGRKIVRVDPHYYRPTEVETLLGDPTKARSKLGWEPAISFKQLVAEMVREDLNTARRDALSQAHGHRIYYQNE